MLIDIEISLTVELKLYTRRQRQQFLGPHIVQYDNESGYVPWRDEGRHHMCPAATLWRGNSSQPCLESDHWVILSRPTATPNTQQHNVSTNLELCSTISRQDHRSSQWHSLSFSQLPPLTVSHLNNMSYQLLYTVQRKPDPPLPPRDRSAWIHQNQCSINIPRHDAIQ